MEIFKIRNKETGLYWEGSIRDAYNDISKLKFTEKGKQWKQKSHCTLAIRSYGNKCEARDFLKTHCVIVKFELKEVEIINIE